MHRNPYSSDDENHLIKYLAAYNQDGKARKGNAIYIQLTSNTDGRWPWSKRHTWQSWRDHYVKNELRFDKKIKAFQKRVAIHVKDGAEDVKHESAMKAEEGSSAHTGVQVNLKKRGRVSPGHVNKRRKMTDKPVDMQQHASRVRSGSGENDAESEKILVPDTQTEQNAMRQRLPSAEERILSEHLDADVDERREAVQLLGNATESSLNASENGKVVQRANEIGPSSSVMKAETVAMNSPPPHSDNSFNSLFDSDHGGPVSDNEEGSKNNNNRKPRKVYRRRDEDDFFQTSPEGDAIPPRDPSKNMSRRRQPPILIEGPFSTTFTTTPPKLNTCTDSDSPGGPPPAEVLHNGGESKVPINERQRSPFSGEQTTRAEASVESDRDTHTWPLVRGNLQSSRIATDYREKRLDRTNEVDGSPEVQKKYSNASLHRKDSEDLARDQPTVDSKGIKRKPSDKGGLIPSLAPIISEEHQSTHLLHHQSFPMEAPATTSTKLAALQSYPRHVKSQNYNDKERIPAHSSSARRYYLEPSHNETVNSPKTSARTGPRDERNCHIDLREERRKRVHPRQSTNSSRSGSVVANHSTLHSSQQSISLQLSTQDQSLVATLGIQQAITMMSINHGFTEDVVSRILQTVNNIAKTDEILRLMKIKAEQEAEKLLILNVAGISASSHMHYKPKYTSTDRRLQISSLSDEEHVSDYSPPPKTRASQFTRLVEQGRHAEAYTREARRASGTISPFKLAPGTPDRENTALPYEALLSETQDGEEGVVPECLEEEAETETETEILGNSQQSLTGHALEHQEENEQENVITEGAQDFNTHTFEIQEESETDNEIAEYIHELFDAHALVADALKRKEEGLGLQPTLRRVQQVATFLKEVLTTHQI
ncbi:hypothetical protein APHAL10511_007193 [Amanita phalloides]|nr:hypothetical protein APHAL10511_007193 [Amanita phalloides]